MGFNVAIDGPAGAGKSSVAKAVAKTENFIYVDTGAMYRAIGLFMVRNGVDIHDAEKVGEKLPEVFVTIRYEEGVQKVILNDEDVSGFIRTEEVSNAASVTSSYPAVRAKLFELQQSLARENDIIMDGRDIGTVILPNADLKIYLTASVEERARRRYLENLEKGIECMLAEIEEDVRERDYRDMNRETAPLRQAEDAYLLDSSNMTMEEVVEKIVSMVDEIRNGK